MSDQRHGLAIEDLDLTLSPDVQRRLPGLATALDGKAMAAHIQRSLQTATPLTACKATQSSYLGDSCLVRYRVSANGSDALVSARVFADETPRLEQLTTRLEPLADQAGTRAEFAHFGRPVGDVAAVQANLWVFPIDPELPQLVPATDNRTMAEVLADQLSRATGEPLAVDECEIELGHYGRLHRCVLRYRLQPHGAAEESPPMVVYGKLAADDRGVLVGDVVNGLRARIGSQVAIPRMLGYAPDLRLALFEALPGVPQVAQLVRSRLGDVPAQGATTPTLEEALDTCARIAAVLHESGLHTPRLRTFKTEAAALRESFTPIRAISPRLADQLDSWLEAAEEAEAAAGTEDPPSLSHGDFSYTQLIFDGAQAGLVDFDTICRAEPALDLGHFLAYLDLAAGKASGDSREAVAVLQDRFLQSYAEARGLDDVDRVFARSAAFQALSLLRLAAHSWQKLKPRRLGLVLDALHNRFALPLGGLG